MKNENKMKLKLSLLVITTIITITRTVPFASVDASSAAGAVRAPPRPPNNNPRGASSRSSSSTVKVSPPSATVTTPATSISTDVDDDIGIDDDEGDDDNDGTIGAAIVDMPMKLMNAVRHKINLNGILGSPTRPTNSGQSCLYNGYDKIMGQPVFQVTTGWGSSYMNMEKLTVDDLERQQKEEPDESGVDCIGGKSTSTSLTDSITTSAKDASEATSLGAEDNTYRTISLYYMDPNDAIASHSEFKQMDGMANQDVRITSVSLGKAMRSASHLGKGLLTGQPINTHTGKVLSTKKGGSLRHKIMPPKKQLFYAAKCIGKERIGFFSNKVDPDTGLSDRDSQYDHAMCSVLGNNALTHRNLSRRQAKRDRGKFVRYQPKNQYEAQNLHMDGYLGLPVFYLEGLERRKSRIKSLISGGSRKEIPLFFNYEDLEQAWLKTKLLDKDSKNVPPSKLPPNTVEVFNLWNVITSMEREHQKSTTLQQQQHSYSTPKSLIQSIFHPITNRYQNVIGNNNNDDHEDSRSSVLDSIVFIPSSDATTYKESITARGNGEARLKPMRGAMSVRRGGNGSFFGLV